MIKVLFFLGFAFSISAHAMITTAELQFTGDRGPTRDPILLVTRDFCSNKFPSATLNSIKKIADDTYDLELQAIAPCPNSTRTTKIPIPIGPKLKDVGITDATAVTFYWHEAGKGLPSEPVQVFTVVNETGVAYAGGVTGENCSSAGQPDLNAAKQMATRLAREYCESLQSDLSPTQLTPFEPSRVECVWAGAGSRTPSNRIYAKARFICE